MASASEGPSDPRPGALDWLVGSSDRGYHAFRVVFASLIGVLYVSGVFAQGAMQPLVGGPTARQMSAILGWAIGLFILSTVIALFARSGLRQPADRVLWALLPFDLVAAGMLVWATGSYQDPFYPWILGLAIAYAALMHRRDAWVVAALAASVYLFAHFVGHGGMHGISDIILLIFKGAAIVFIGSVASSLMQNQSEREERLIESRVEIEELNERISRRLAELHAVSEITEVIHSTLDFDRVGPLVLDILSKVIDLPASALFVIDKDKDATLFSASSGVAASVARGTTESYMLGSPGRPDDTFACTTILDHKRLMVVFCAPGDRLEGMSKEDRLVLQAVASELVVAVENSQLYKLTKRLSITDELTGLFNYRYLQQRLEDEVERARRYGRSLSLLMLDADDFKKFNDTHGHVAGDAALADLAETLRTAVREIDVACRYGGEEFAVILPETDAEGAFVVAEKIREAVSLRDFTGAAGERGVRVTVSIGLATFPATAEDREELLRQADEALYQAKTTGRNRVRAPSGLTITVPVADVARIDGGESAEATDEGGDRS